MNTEIQATNILDKLLRLADLTDESVDSEIPKLINELYQEVPELILILNERADAFENMIKKHLQEVKNLNIKGE